jgi:hypothetical protein
MFAARRCTPRCTPLHTDALHGAARNFLSRRAKSLDGCHRMPRRSMPPSAKREGGLRASPSFAGIVRRVRSRIL